MISSSKHSCIVERKSNRKRKETKSARKLIQVVQSKQSHVGKQAGIVFNYVGHTHKRDHLAPADAACI